MVEKVVEKKHECAFTVASNVILLRKTFPNYSKYIILLHTLKSLVQSSSWSCLEALTTLFRLSMKEKFDVYLLSPFGEKVFSIYYKHVLILAAVWSL